MRIAVLFARFGPYHVARLRALAHRHEVVGVELSGENLNYAWAPIEVDGLQHRQLFDGNHRAVRRSRLRSALAALLDRVAPDVVAVPGWWDPGALLAIQWARKHDVPAILMSDSARRDHPRTRWKEHLKSRVVRLCQAGLVAGRRHEAYLTDLGMPSERIYRGYDVVDNMHFAEGADRARDRADKLRSDLNVPESYFLTCCRFVEKKNLPFLLRAYAQYHAQSAAPRSLVLVGDGPKREALEHQARDLGIAAHVQMPGFKQYDELPSFYGLADAFIQPSIREQWGLVVNEAMAAGLPVLVSKACGCAPDLVAEGENGYTFDPTNAETLATLLGEMSGAACNPAAMGEESRRRIAEWTPAVFAEQMTAAARAAQSASPPSLRWSDSLLLRGLAWNAGE